MSKRRFTKYPSGYVKASFNKAKPKFKRGDRVKVYNFNENPIGTVVCPQYKNNTIYYYVDLYGGEYRGCFKEQDLEKCSDKVAASTYGYRRYVKSSSDSDFERFFNKCWGDYCKAIDDEYGILVDEDNCFEYQRRWSTIRVIPWIVKEEIEDIFNEYGADYEKAMEVIYDNECPYDPDLDDI